MSLVRNPQDILRGNSPVNPTELAEFLQFLQLQIQSAGLYIYNTRLEMEAVVPSTADAVAWVLDDGVDSGFYRYNDPNWAKTADDPGWMQNALTVLGALATADTVGTSELDDRAVSLSKLADLAGGMVIGNAGTESGPAALLDADALRTLLNVANGATANDSNESLKSRANHSGTQAISTIVGLQDALNGKAPASEGMTSQERTKLQGIAPSATANDTDANLKSRSNHSGTQAISTIDGLSEALNEKATSDAVTGAIAGLRGAPGRLERRAGMTTDRVGAPETRSPYLGGTIVADADLGRCLELDGSVTGPAALILAEMTPTPVEAGAVYKLSASLKRTVDSLDPVSSTAVLVLRRLREDYSFLSDADIVSVAPVVADGVVTLTGTASTEEGHDATISSAARYIHAQIVLHADPDQTLRLANLGTSRATRSGDLDDLPELLDGFATAEQGARADTALQQSDPVSRLSETDTRKILKASEREKLETVQGGATKNAADSTLLSRTNHTGLQSIATVEGLQEALEGKALSSDLLVETATRITDVRRTRALLGDRIGRPGDFPENYVSSLGGGAPDDLPAVTGVVTTPTGAALQIIGAGLVAQRWLSPIEPNHTYRLRARLRRLVNSSDPAGDALRLAVAWYDQNRIPLSTAQSVLLELPDLPLGSGEVELAGTISATDLGADVQAPVGAAYFRAFAETFGSSPQTAVVLLSARDMTDATSYAPDVSSLETRVTVIEAGQYAQRVQALESAMTAPQRLVVDLAGNVASTSVAATVTELEVVSGSVSGDGAGGRYRRAANEPTHAQKLQSLDGAWWELRSNPTLMLGDGGLHGQERDTIINGRVYTEDENGGLASPATNTLLSPKGGWIDIFDAFTQTQLTNDFADHVGALMVDCHQKNVGLSLSPSRDGQPWQTRFWTFTAERHGNLHIDFQRGFTAIGDGMRQQWSMDGSTTSFTVTDFDVSQGISAMFVEIGTTNAQKIHSISETASSAQGQPRYTLVGNTITLSETRDGNYLLVAAPPRGVLRIDGGRRAGYVTNLSFKGSATFDGSNQQAIIASSSGGGVGAVFCECFRSKATLSILNRYSGVDLQWDQRRLDSGLTTLGNRISEIDHLDVDGASDNAHYDSGDGIDDGTEDNEYTFVKLLRARRCSNIGKSVRLNKGYTVAHAFAKECVNGFLDGDTQGIVSGREMRIANYLADNPLEHALDWRNLQGGCSIGSMTVREPGLFEDGTQYAGASGALRLAAGRKLQVGQFSARYDKHDPVPNLPAILMNGGENFAIDIQQAMIERFDVGVRETGASGAASGDVGTSISGKMVDVAQPFDLQSDSTIRYDFDVVNTSGSAPTSKRYSGVGVAAQIPDEKDFQPTVFYSNPGDAVIQLSDQHMCRMRRFQGGWALDFRLDFSHVWTHTPPSGLFRIGLGESGLPSAFGVSAQVFIANYNVNWPFPEGRIDPGAFFESEDDDLRFRVRGPGLENIVLTADHFAAKSVSGQSRTFRCEGWFVVLDKIP